MPAAVTVMDCEVADVDQRYDIPAGAVRMTLPPGQKVVEPLAMIVAGGNGLTVTVVAGDDATQPAASVTVTAKLPLEPTVIDCVVAPLVQPYELPLEAVSVTLPPAQNVVGPLGVIVGGAEAGATLTT